jgi:hypothetical protein
LLATLSLLAPSALLAQSAERKAGVPASHQPPAGLCRIWVDGVPPAKQPAPTDCATALRNKPANGTVVFGATRPGPAVRGGSQVPSQVPSRIPVNALRTVPLPRTGARPLPPPRDSARTRPDSVKARRDTTLGIPPAAR